MARGRRLSRLKSAPLLPAAEPILLDWDTQQLLANPMAFPRLTSQALFGNQALLEVEIGCGTGEYLAWLAGEDAHTNFLGVEVSHRAALHAANLAAGAGCTNLRIIRADFKLLLPLLDAHSWRRVYLHFPDPVHKREDKKRSLYNQAFLDTLAAVLVPGGEFSVASDKRDYFMQMLELAEGDSRFEKVHPERYLEGLDAGAKSRFQRFWERKGVAPLRLLLRRLV